jgi:hypothetical protein
MLTNWKTGGAIAAMALFGAVVAASAQEATLGRGIVATDLDCKGCVNTRELGTRAVTGKKIKGKSVGKGKLKNNAVATEKIRDGAVTGDKIGDGAVGNGNLANNAVNSAKIEDGTVSPDDLSDTAKPAGIAYSSGDQDVAVTGADTVFRTVTLEAPADGYAVVNASWVIYGRNILTQCSITTGTTVETTHLVETQEANVALIALSSSAVRGFPVTAGDNTFNLVCSASIGSPNIRDSSLVATYVPGSY